MITADAFDRWLRPEAAGLYCVPGGFYIDPHRAVDRAVITHGHSDHARAGHAHVLATSETIAVMKSRMGPKAAASFQVAMPGAPTTIGDVTVRLVPAGHILGSAQIVLDYRGCRAVVSGDYKRHGDPTCQPFEVVRCDLFVTEATFGLPVFRHAPDTIEIQKLLTSLALFPERTHLIGVYSLGKCQRMIALLRAAGYDKPIWLHAALKKISDLYVEFGIPLGDIRSIDEVATPLAGEIVMGPPTAQGNHMARLVTDPVIAFASGWMGVRGRAGRGRCELPLIISDHCDWPELLQSIEETGASEIWVTHGREAALVHQIGLMGRRGRALALIGRDTEVD
jgi:putative mRNA 3-end processing factor